MKQALLPIGLLAAAAVLGCGGDGNSDENGGQPGSCADCVGHNTGPVNMPDLAVSCEPSGEQFECICMTQSGATTAVFLSATGCQ